MAKSLGNSNMLCSYEPGTLLEKRYDYTVNTVNTMHECLRNSQSTVRRRGEENNSVVIFLILPPITENR